MGYMVQLLNMVPLKFRKVILLKMIKTRKNKIMVVISKLVQLIPPTKKNLKIVKR